MKVDKENNWKKKIDPAFDDLIKVYLDYIKFTHICSLDKRKRYLTLEDASLKVMERKGYPPLLKEFNPDQRDLKELMNDIVVIRASSDSKLISESIEYIVILVKDNEDKKLKREIKSKYEDALKSNIISMIKGLPREDSRNYYKRRLEIDLSTEEAKPLTKKKVHKKIAVTNEMLKDIFCLMHQTGIKGYWGSQGESYNDKEIDKLNFINLVMQQVYDDISKRAYKKSLIQLLEEARNDDEILYKAIRLDKTLFDEDWVRERIRKAFYSGDSRFFNELGKAIIKYPIPLRGIQGKFKVEQEESILEYGKLTLILLKLWPIGLCRLEIRELVGLLKACGLSTQEDDKTFRTYINRLRKSNVLLDLDKLITM